MKFTGKKEIFIIIGILAVCVAVYGVYSFGFAKDDGIKAEIYYYSDLVKTVDLSNSEEKTFTIPQDEHVKLKISKNGNIAFAESDCPDKVCVNTGKIHIPGQSAACLPNGIIIKLVSDDDGTGDPPDAVIGN